MHPRLKSIGFAMLLVCSTGIALCVPTLNGRAAKLIRTGSFVLAQSTTTPDRKAEGDRLLQKGIQQYQTSQFEAAMESWQQALQIYREIKDRQGKDGHWAIWELLTAPWVTMPKRLSMNSNSW